MNDASTLNHLQDIIPYDVWPSPITLHNGVKYMGRLIAPYDALIIVTDSVNKWLRSEGWVMIQTLSIPNQWIMVMNDENLRYGVFDDILKAVEHENNK